MCQNRAPEHFKDRNKIQQSTTCNSQYLAANQKIQRSGKIWPVTARRINYSNRSGNDKDDEMLDKDHKAVSVLYAPHTQESRGKHEHEEERKGKVLEDTNGTSRN